MSAISTDLPAEAFVASLAGFERMTSARLRSLLRHHGAVGGFEVATGMRKPAPPVAPLFANSKATHTDGLARLWSRDGLARPPAVAWEACERAGIRVLLPTDEEFPPQLLADPASPPVLFVRGDLAGMAARRVGIVGTRNATQRGRETAAQLGHELAGAGVTVLSGLARGIDGAAHRGALSVDGATPIGIVGNGLDRPYPKQHTDLWAAVARRGALISEWPPGTPPDAFRFPLRNRILAALIEVLVVVESRERGGSLITAREASNRSVEVMAVPGALHNRAAIGTNQLLRDGAAPVTETADVLAVLGLDTRREGRRKCDPRPTLTGPAVAVFEACRSEARTLDALLLVTGQTLAETALIVARMERDGWLHEVGGWFEAIDAWADLA